MSAAYNHYVNLTDYPEFSHQVPRSNDGLQSLYFRSQFTYLLHIGILVIKTQLNRREEGPYIK